MHNSDHPCPRLVVERFHQRVVRYALTPVGAHGDDACPMPPCDFSDPSAEEAALGDDHRVAGLDEVHDAGLHAGRARAVEREHQDVRHPVHAQQQADDVEEDLVHLRVEMAEHRPCHRLEYGGIHVRRPGPAEQPLRRSKLGESVFHPLRLAQVHDDCKLRVLRDI